MWTWFVRMLHELRASLIALLPTHNSPFPITLPSPFPKLPLLGRQAATAQGHQNRLICSFLVINVVSMFPSFLLSFFLSVCLSVCLSFFLSFLLACMLPSFLVSRQLTPQRPVFDPVSISMGFVVDKLAGTGFPLPYRSTNAPYS